MSRKLIISLILFISILFTFSQCSSDIDYQEDDRTGEFSFSISGLDLEVKTRQENNGILVDISDLEVKIEDSEGKIVKSFQSVDDVPESLRLKVGNYKIYAYYGSDKESGFNSYFVYGEEEFEIKNKQNTSVTFICSLANVKVTVDYDSNMDEYSDYYVEVWEKKTPNKIVRFSKDETRPAFIPSGEAYIKVYTVGDDGILRASKPTAIEVDPKTHLKLNISKNEVSGSVDLAIQIITDTEEKEINIELPSFMLPSAGPDLQLSGFDAATGHMETYEGIAPEGEFKVEINAPGGIKSCIITPSQELIDTGWPAEPFDLIEAANNDAIASQIKGLGLDWPSNMEGSRLATLDLKGIVPNLCTQPGQQCQFPLDICITDNYGQTSETVTCSFNINAPEFSILSIPEGDVWATKISAGVGIGTDNGNPKANLDIFRVEAQENGGEWINYDIKTATPANDGAKFEVSGLPSGKELKLRLKYNNHYSDEITVQTEDATQVPYSNFNSEYWYEYKRESGSDINQFYLHPSDAPDSDKWWSTRNPASGYQKSGAKNDFTRNNGTYPVGDGDDRAAELLSTAWGRGNSSITNTYNVTAGILFIGDYTCEIEEKNTPLIQLPGSGIMIDEEIIQGRPFASRPATFQFQYKFSPIDNERFMAYAIVEHRNGDQITELGRASVSDAVASTAIGEMTNITPIPFEYNADNAHLKATHICIFFSSSHKLGGTIGERPAIQGSGLNLHSGSRLTIDNLQLGYDF